jgi:hypothetical protein
MKTRVLLIICDKAIYGLKQAPRTWYSRLNIKLKTLGFSASKVDSSLFFYYDSTCTMFVLLYVDDIIIASSSSKFTSNLVKKLNQEFTLKDLRDRPYFLGIEVKRTNEGLLITMERYAQDIVTRANMSSCKAITTPMTLGDKMLVNDGEPLGPKDAL